MAHTPLKMTGPKTDVNGITRMSVYSSDDIKDWIIGKLGLTAGQARSRGGSITSVISDFLNGRGKATSGPSKAGGASHTSKYRGSPVYHASAGKAGTSSGITIFYVNAQGTDGKIIGIGQHKNSTSYDVEWHASDWHVGRVITLS